MGKTSWAMRFIQGSPHERVFIFDHQNEFSHRFGIAENKIAHTSEEFLRLAETERVVCFDFTLFFPGDKRDCFAAFCDLVFDSAGEITKTGRETLFVCDELQQFVTGTQIESAPEQFRQILETGRRRGLDSLSLSRAPNRVNVAIREEFTELILFRLNDEQSLKFAREVGADVGLVSKLPKHHYLYYNVMTGRENRLELVFRGRGEMTPDAVIV